METERQTSFDPVRVRKNRDGGTASFANDATLQRARGGKTTVFSQGISRIDALSRVRDAVPPP